MDWPPSRPEQAAHTALDQTQRATDVVGIGTRRNAPQVPDGYRIMPEQERVETLQLLDRKKKVPARFIGSYGK